nr:MFS transporter [Cellulosimicrobium sp. CUA-896]
MFGAFVAAMTVMRLAGTRLIDRFGRVVVLRASGVTSIAGLVLFGFAPTLALAGVGVVLWGFGAALAVPVGIAAASDEPLRAAGRVSVVSAFSSMAALAAPPLLGLAAEAIGARHALVLIVGAMVLSVALARQVAPLRPADETAARRAGEDGGVPEDLSCVAAPDAPARRVRRRLVVRARAPPSRRRAAVPAPGPPRGDVRMTSTVPRAARVAALAAWAVFAVFFLNGFNFATWASRLPAVRDALGFAESQMGLLLLFAAFGSLLALPLSGLVVERLGAARAVVAFAVVNTAGLVTTVFAVAEGTDWVVRAGLFLMGVGTGVWDAAMNLEGAAVEQRLGRTIMPRFHAGFSFGTVAGAGVGALAAAAGVPVQWHVTVAVGLSLLAVLWAVRWFVPAGDGHGPGEVDVRTSGGDAQGADPATAVPVPSAAAADGRHGGARSQLSAWTEPRTLLIGLVVLAAALTEGAANDWVSLAVVDGFGTDNAMGAVGLAVFLTAMTGMRLLGTGLLDRYGRVVVLRLSAGLALAGLLVFGLVPNLWFALVGVALWGLGAALGFPVGMSAASDDPRRAAVRVSVVATIGYSAFFVGPPLIGFLAHEVGYRNALLVIAVPVVVGLLVVGAARPLPATGQAEPGDPADGPPQGQGDARTSAADRAN